jgi:DNA-binding response OmpR family regulator
MQFEDQPPAPTPASPPRLTDVSKPILVVDDDPSLLSIVADLLELEGHRVERAHDGKQALEAIERIDPMLVLLDMRMPVVDGRRFVGELKARGITLPIIVMTGSSDARAWAREIGAAAVLPKPFDVNSLLNTVERLRNGA